eukprot:7383642-Prymnesium_polylepis.2
MRPTFDSILGLLSDSRSVGAQALYITSRASAMFEVIDRHRVLRVTSTTQQCDTQPPWPLRSKTLKN